VVVDDVILGKPRDADDAARMLRLLSGRTHAVITGVCLVGPVASSQFPVGPAASCQLPVASKTETASETTLVTIKRSAATLRLANLWTRRGLMRSKVSPRAGSRASRATTAMW
jgi:hypothetical protein